jgi:hypothetical protein
VSNRTPSRALAVLVLTAVTVAGCTSSKSGGDVPSTSAPPTLVAPSNSGQVHLRASLVQKVPGTFKQKPDAEVNKSTGYKQAIHDDGRKKKKAFLSLRRDRFQSTYQRVWTGFGGSTLRVILQQFAVVGGARTYQRVLGAVLMKQLGDTTPVTVSGVPSATAFTHKTKKRQTTIILVAVGVVLMQVRLTGKVALGQVGIAVAVATKQFKRL